MELTATVDRIVFKSGDSGFTVLAMTDEKGVHFSAVGAMPLAERGDRLCLNGEWGWHAKFGSQFQVESASTAAPADERTLVEYLASGQIYGVGDVTARSIVDKFGMDTIDVIENSPERLTEINGIGEKKARTISRSFAEKRALRDVIMALSVYGVTVNQAMKLFKRYGDLCLLRVKENPYRMIDDVEGIGFKTADSIALNSGVEHDSAFRIEVGIMYALKQAQLSGHTCCSPDEVAELSARLLGVELLPCERALAGLIERRRLTTRRVGENDMVFLPYLFHQEAEAAKRLYALASRLQLPVSSNAEADIAALEQKLGISLAGKQREAVKTALTGGALVITGGPGTGKTTILKFIIALMRDKDYSIELCAPTGRAAKRMEEATGFEARTIHRLLEFGQGGESFMRGPDDPIEADVVIVDEMSMVDTQLLWALLRALEDGTRLIMVGDVDQLPSVGAGNVLRDIIDSKTVPVIRLDEVFRQSEQSMIIENAHLINSGRCPDLDAEAPDFKFIESLDPAFVRAEVLRLASGGIGYDPYTELQILTPMRAGAMGVIELNAALQARLNPAGEGKHEVAHGGTLFREGDKVMQIKNNYRLEWTREVKGGLNETGVGVYNGDIGTVMKIDHARGSIAVVFDDGRAAEYDLMTVDELSLAYAVSVHKSQGSEFKAVIIVLLGVPPLLCTRNLLYTAVTRAKRSVTVIGSRTVFKRMVATSNIGERHTGLMDFLLEERYAR